MEAWETLQDEASRVIDIRFEQGLEALNDAERILYLAWCFDGIVCNGGHQAFFAEQTGQFAHETVDALRRIGAVSAADGLERCVRLFKDRTVPKDFDARTMQLAKLPRAALETLEQSDELYFPISDETYTKLLDYWNTNSRLASGD